MPFASSYFGSVVCGDAFEPEECALPGVSVVRAAITSATIKDAITSGRLSGLPWAPIGQASGAVDKPSVVSRQKRSKRARFVAEPIMPT